MDICLNGIEVDPLEIYLSPIKLYTCLSSNIVSTKYFNTCENKFNIPVQYENYNVATKLFTVTNSIQILLNQEIFTLQEFHIHDMAEHIIDDHKGDLEIHFVFFNNKTPACATVLAFIFKNNNDIASNIMITNILKNKPFIIPNIYTYFTYSGSLTKTLPVAIPQIAINWLVSYTTCFLNITKNDLETIRYKSRGSSSPYDRNGRNVCVITNASVCC